MSVPRLCSSTRGSDADDCQARSQRRGFLNNVPEAFTFLIAAIVAIATLGGVLMLRGWWKVVALLIGAVAELYILGYLPALPSIRI